MNLSPKDNYDDQVSTIEILTSGFNNIATQVAVYFPRISVVILVLLLGWLLARVLSWLLVRAMIRIADVEVHVFDITSDYYTVNHV
jgi:hypothetical protein